MLEVSISFLKNTSKCMYWKACKPCSHGCYQLCSCLLGWSRFGYLHRLSSQSDSWQRYSFILSAPSGTLRCSFLFINQVDHEMYLRCNIKCPHVLKGPTTVLWDFTLLQPEHESCIFCGYFYFFAIVSRPRVAPHLWWIQYVLAFVVAAVWVGIPGEFFPCIWWRGSLRV